MSRAQLRYALTHDPDLIERYDLLAHRVLPVAGIPAPRGLRERAARTRVAYPLLALDGDAVVGGICATVRDAGNDQVALPEEEGTASRLLGCHPLLARRFVWANHLCIDPRYRTNPIFRELTCHLAALARLFDADAVGMICKQDMVALFQAACRRYFGVLGQRVEPAFDLPQRYRDSGAAFLLFAAQTLSPPGAAVRRIREHCERHAIPLPAPPAATAMCD
jgi:hypothetical protein